MTNYETSMDNDDGSRDVWPKLQGWRALSVPASLWSGPEVRPAAIDDLQGTWIIPDDRPGPPGSEVMRSRKTHP